nr:MAG TPA: hypothetical protein [Caudoviricetes sp.]
MDKKQTFKDRFSDKNRVNHGFCANTKCCYINHLALVSATVVQYNCIELTRFRYRFSYKYPFLGCFHGFLSHF